jgi:hypothetical protein
MDEWPPEPKHVHQYVIPVETVKEPLARTIPLTKGRVALVDSQDYEWLSHQKWQFDGRYARNPNGTMHRMIFGTGSDTDTDHINGNKLDNRRCNLRVVSRSQNIMNSPRENKYGYKGVHKLRDTYYARLMKPDGTTINRGGFHTPEEAAKAWDALVREYRGPDYYTNFREPESITVAVERVTKLRCACGEEISR